MLTSWSFICFIVDDIKILVLQNIIACFASETTFLMDKHLHFFYILSLVIFNILSLSHITKVKWIVLVTSVSCWIRSLFWEGMRSKNTVNRRMKAKVSIFFLFDLCGCVNNNMMTDTWWTSQFTIQCTAGEKLNCWKFLMQPYNCLSSPKQQQKWWQKKGERWYIFR